MKTTKVTRRTTVGFGYTSACENDERGNLQVCKTTQPCHTGTIGQVSKAISEDRTLASYRGGTCYSTAWFVKIGGKFHEIIGEFDQEQLHGLLMERPRADYKYDGRKYYDDSVTVTIE